MPKSVVLLILALILPAALYLAAVAGGFVPAIQPPPADVPLVPF